METPTSGKPLFPLWREMAKSWGLLNDADRGVLWKQLLEVVKDKNIYARRAAVSALGEIAKAWGSLSDAERDSLLKRLLKAFNEPRVNVYIAIALAKFFQDERLIQYFKGTDLSQRFVQALERRPETHKLSFSSSFALAHTLQLQGYQFFEVEKLLNSLRAQYLQTPDLQNTDSPYVQNPLNCFLSNPLILDQDFPRQLFETLRPLLESEPSWYPKRMMLPILLQTQWSLVVLDCHYEKSEVELLCDESGSGRGILRKLLSSLKTAMNRLIQHQQGVFREYRFKIREKRFNQIGLTQPSIDSGPIMVQNIEDYLKHSKEPLNHFIETDKLFTLKQFNPKDYPDALQAIRSKHRGMLLGNLPDTQLSRGALLFKYSHLPANIESLVLEYCGEEIPKPSFSGSAALPTNNFHELVKKIKQGHHADFSYNQEQPILQGRLPMGQLIRFEV